MDIIFRCHFDFQSWLRTVPIKIGCLFKFIWNNMTTALYLPEKKYCLLSCQHYLIYQCRSTTQRIYNLLKMLISQWPIKLDIICSIESCCHVVSYELEQTSYFYWNSPKPRLKVKVTSENNVHQQKLFVSNHFSKILSA
jgi:hypothetical protein